MYKLGLQRLAFLASRGGIIPQSRRLLALQHPHRAAFFSTDNITYSGGQAIDGQGGFYGSGGARASPATEEEEEIALREGVLAMASDVQKIAAVIKEVETLESLLERESDPASSQSISLKANIKKLMTNSEVTKSLERLEVQGEPVWGLSSEERELVALAREKMNDC